jgi:hypothetical protein
LSSPTVRLKVFSNLERSFSPKFERGFFAKARAKGEIPTDFYSANLPIPFSEREITTARSVFEAVQGPNAEC